MLSGPRAMEPGLQLWIRPWPDVLQQREAVQLLPTLPLGASRFHGPFPKIHISDKTKMVHQTTEGPFEDLPEHIQVPADTNSPKSFFCATGSTVYTRSKTARSHIGSPAVSSVPQLSSLQREREAEPSPTKTSANQPGLLVA